MKKSICCIALALVMALSTVGLFASCAKEKEKTLVMATNANFPPYEYKDGAAFAGIDVELAQAIADKLGMKLEIQDVEFGAIVAGVESGKYDIGMAGMTVTEDRKKQGSFHLRPRRAGCHSQGRLRHPVPGRHHHLLQDRRPAGHHR